MDLITLSFLIPLGIIGVLCSYTDLKYGKIPNKLIGVGFVYGIFLFLSLFIYDRFSFQNRKTLDICQSLQSTDFWLFWPVTAYGISSFGQPETGNFLHSMLFWFL